MDRRVKVHQAGNGAPWATIPSRFMWDLVEYLACRRTRVLYTSGAKHFHVMFLSLHRAAAQQVLEDWAQAGTDRWREDRAMEPGAAGREESVVPVS